MARPYWSGQLRISLVSFGIKLFTATETKSEIRFHQLNRKTGERIKYQKTSGDAASGEQSSVQMSDIVKGYEYRKGEYVMIEPKEIESLRIPSKTTLDITQFVDESEIDPEFFERPYFVAPENDAQTEAFAVVRKALLETKKMALGKIAFAGREHLVAIGPAGDDAMPGMMAYTMRYAEELRKPSEYFGDIKKTVIDEDQLAMAKELIQRKVAKFAPEKFKDEYEATLRAFVEAKVENRPVEHEAPAPKSTKVVSLMDALRKSVQGVTAEESTPVGAPTKKKPAPDAETAKGIALVKDTPKDTPAKKAVKSRKSA